MRRITIEANTYAGQIEEVMTFAAPEVLFTHVDQGKDTVYTLIKAYWEAKQPTSAGFAGISLRDALGD